MIQIEDMDGNWTMDQLNELTRDFIFHESVTDRDKYIAFNIAYDIWEKDFDEKQILRIAYDFFFCDDRWPMGKVLGYVCAANNV